MLEFAHQQAKTRNVFLIQARDDASLTKAYVHIVRRIGHDQLLKGLPGYDLQQVWNNLSEEEKIDRFKQWLGTPENNETLFLVDDMDGLRKWSDRTAALPGEARTIIYTSRDPVFHSPDTRDHLTLRMSTMPCEDLISIMKHVRDSEINNLGINEDGDIYDQKTLLDIASNLDGHPLAASIAMKYIIRELSHNDAQIAGRQFVFRFRGNDPKMRRHFLNFTQEAPTIMETFYISKDRLTDPDGAAWRLMEICSMLHSPLDGIKPRFDARHFLFKHPNTLKAAELKDEGILSGEDIPLGRLFSELERVSFGMRDKDSAGFSFHPLWAECARHQIGPESMLRYAREILLTCYNAMKVANEQEVGKYLIHARHCKRVCTSFKVSLENLEVPEPVHRWIRSLDGKFQDSRNTSLINRQV